MKKIVLTFGIIAGLICGGMFFLWSSGGDIDFTNGQLYGYITMFIAFSTIFFAVKQYRDKYNDGTIRFGKSFMIGLYITLIAAVVYVVAWEIYYSNYGTEFVDQYVAFQKTQLANEGLTPAEIDTKLAGQMEMMDTYKEKTFFRMGLTFLEIFPVGLIMSLISAFVFGVFLRRRTEAKLA